MRICLFTDQELDADPFPADDWPCDPRPFIPEADWTLVTLEKETAVAQVIQASREGYDMVFNLCDGAWDEGRVGIEVVQTLEALGVPFTGADSDFYEPSREAMKRVCHDAGIDTPAYVIARASADLALAADTLRTPLIVKHPNSYASNDLTRDCLVQDPAAMRARARHFIEKYGAALVEEFIEGTEATVLVSEDPEDPECPTTWPPLAYRFPEGECFKHHDLKWVDYAGLQAEPVADPILAATLRTVSARFFVGMRGAGYGRCDIRVDTDGRPWMLEINPNCGVFYPATDPGSADLCLRAVPRGHELFARQLVAAGLARHRRRTPPWRTEPVGGGGYRVRATRRIGAGEVVVAREAQDLRLVSARDREGGFGPATGDACLVGVFRRHAWPLTDDLWVLPSADPEAWVPVRHACEPSAWLSGLDIVARRSMESGDEVTMDYATFRTAPMAPFRCDCGAAACRGTIGPDDHLLPCVDRYGDHVSPRVRALRARRCADAGGAGRV